MNTLKMVKNGLSIIVRIAVHLNRLLCLAMLIFALFVVTRESIVAAANVVSHTLAKWISAVAVLVKKIDSKNEKIFKLCAISTFFLEGNRGPA